MRGEADYRLRFRPSFRLSIADTKRLFAAVKKAGLSESQYCRAALI